MFDDGSDCTDKDCAFSIDSICHDDKENNETHLASATSLEHENIATLCCQIASKTDPGFASKIDPPMKAISAHYSGFV